MELLEHPSPVVSTAKSNRSITSIEPRSLIARIYARTSLAFGSQSYFSKAYDGLLKRTKAKSKDRQDQCTLRLKQLSSDSKIETY